MPFSIWRGDIAAFPADAVVSPSNSSLKAGGGASEAIFRAAGAEQISAACAAIGHCDIGSSVITPAFSLPARYVIHTVGPIWNDGTSGEDRILRSCYRSALRLALENGCESVAFPLISAGIFGCPEDIAFSIASDEISAFLAEHEEMSVTLVRLPGDVSMVNARRRALLAAYLEEHLLSEEDENPRLGPIAAQMREQERLKESGPFMSDICFPLYSEADHSGMFEKRAAEPSEAFFELDDSDAEESAQKALYSLKAPTTGKSLDELLGAFDDLGRETFYDTIVRMVNKKQITLKELRKRSHVTSNVLSKLRYGGNPKRSTAFALAAGLRLNLDETVDFLASAGLALSPYRKTDVIVRYCLENRIFNVDEINSLLDDNGEDVLALG